MDLGKDRPKKKSKRNDGTVNITREELNHLKENEIHFPSSLFRLQTEELLSQVRVRDKTKEDFQKWFADFKRFVRDASQENVDLSNDDCDLLGPVLSRCGGQVKKEKMMYHAPEEMKLIGSFPLDLAVKSTLSVDVMVRIPKKCLHNSDNLNLQYFYKRALYTTHLARLLAKADDLISEMHYEYHHGDELKPILVIRPKVSGASSRMLVKLLPCPPSNHLKLSKLGPSRNNIRHEWMRGKTCETEPATPRYNSCLLSDILMESCFGYLQSVLTTNKSISGGIILLKVWLHQRQLDRGFGCISNFILTSFVAHLLENRKLHPLMSSYQIARNTWLALSQSDWTSARSENLDSAEFFLHFPVVLVDSTSTLNLCSNVARNTYLRLKHEAELAVKLADRAQHFDELFMQPVPFIRKFDHVLHIEPGIKSSFVIRKFKLKDKYVDYIGDEKRIILPILTDVLCKALGERIDLLDVKLHSPPQWKMDELPSIPDHRITIGLLLNPEHYCSILDKGPSAETEEAKEFREFWGPKSELRRFQDTSICEAVTWPGSSVSERRAVCVNVVKYILLRHLNIKNKLLTYIADQMESFVALKFEPVPRDVPQNGTGEELTVNIVAVLDELRQQIQKVDGLPLAVTSVQGVSPSFRYTEVFPPLPLNSRIQKGRKKVNYKVPYPFAENAPKFFQSLDVLITMEGSNKWPNDAEAVRRIKAIFYIKLATLLKEQYALNCTATTERAFVFKGGFLFSICIGYKRESVLMKMKRSADGMLKFLENEKSIALEKDIVQLPKITSTLHGLQLQQGSFSCACRLAKRWISAQLLADHVADMAVELTMAHIFISPAPYTPPKSPQVAFQRWLHLITHHNWKDLPLLLNFNDELTLADLDEITKYFSDNRKTLPPIFIATPYDKFSSCWTRNAPCLPVINQLIKLGAAGLRVLESELENSQSPDLKPLFRPSFEPYDVLIHLNREQTPLNHCSVERMKPFNYDVYEPKKYELIPIVDHDPTSCYLKELRTMFEDYAAFFYDKYGGGTIAVLWKCKNFQPVEFKVSRVNCKKPAVVENEDDRTLAVDVEAIVEDLKILGKGLVQSIDVKTEKWKIY